MPPTRTTADWWAYVFGKIYQTHPLQQNLQTTGIYMLAITYTTHATILRELYGLSHGFVEF